MALSCAILTKKKHDDKSWLRESYARPKKKPEWRRESCSHADDDAGGLERGGATIIDIRVEWENFRVYDVIEGKLFFFGFCWFSRLFESF